MSATAATTTTRGASARDPRVDAYIARSPAFARPILAHLRDVVRSACPEVVETMKWSMPFFDYHGSPLCYMAAFKAHCAFGFWRGKALPDLPTGEGGMGQLGRIGSLDDLPPRRRLTSDVKAAMKLNDAVGTTPRRAAPKAPLAMPDDFAKALNASLDASRNFEAFTPGNRRDYIEWIVDAKRDDTRASRIAQAIAWIAEGRTRHWKYRSSHSTSGMP